MDESERLQRYKREGGCEKDDREFAQRISALLNHPKIDRYCMVDAYYYDFSVIPEAILRIKNFYRDVYLLFGITTDGEIITKWVERYDLDSQYPIVDGEVVKPEEKGGCTRNTTCTPVPPEILQFFNKSLLSMPVVCSMFDKKDLK